MTLVSILYLILAILGLSFLVFIHELGHYFMARRRGMRVETFSIGFGKPIYKWVRDGVNWQIGILPFGGFVKIAGMEMSDQNDIYEVKDGFFGKSPLDRIIVAFAGPFVNIVFAFLAFTALWFAGGRSKSFIEYTHKIGWVDPKSELYMEGVRPGDEISYYNDQPYTSAKDHILAPIISGKSVTVKGFHVNYLTQEKTPFEYTIKPYPLPNALNKDRLTTGIFQPASYIIFQNSSADKTKNLSYQNRLIDSGLQYNDRIVWVDGFPIYSLMQLNTILNDSKALLTIKRGDEVFLRRVPRVFAEELKFDQEFREELIDWQFEAGLNATKIQKLYTIPYNLNNNCVVEAPVRFIDQEKEEEFFPEYPLTIIGSALKAGDRILAVDGTPVEYSYQILEQLQQKHLNIIVQRMDGKAIKLTTPLWDKADDVFDKQFKSEDLQRLISQIGLPSSLNQSGNLFLLGKVVPQTRQEFNETLLNSHEFAEQVKERNKKIDAIEDPVKRAQYLQLLAQQDKQLVLGLMDIEDTKVVYNPNPIDLFKSVAMEIFQTLKALFTGSLSVKGLSGPVGIVHIVHDNSMSGLTEAIFWLGAISLNLGLLNLLPLPVLDGGTICIALFEWISGKRLKAKTLERLIIPFALFLIGLFIFLTYNDILRIFG